MHVNNKITDSEWVYVGIQNPGGNEHYVGRFNKELGVSYIPVFQDKETAIACLARLQGKVPIRYEVQAVLVDELVSDAVQNGFAVCIVDIDGRIIKNLT